MLDEQVGHPSLPHEQGAVQWRVAYSHRLDVEPSAVLQQAAEQLGWKETGNLYSILS